MLQERWGGGEVVLVAHNGHKAIFFFNLIVFCVFLFVYCFDCYVFMFCFNVFSFCSMFFDLFECLLNKCLNSHGINDFVCVFC